MSKKRGTLLLILHSGHEHCSFNSVSFWEKFKKLPTWMFLEMFDDEESRAVSSTPILFALWCLFCGWVSRGRSPGRHRGADRNLRGHALLCQREPRLQREEGMEGKCGMGSNATASQAKSPPCFVCMPVLDGYAWCRRKAAFVTRLRKWFRISQTRLLSWVAPVIYLLHSNTGGKARTCF